MMDEDKKKKAIEAILIAVLIGLTLAFPPIGIILLIIYLIKTGKLGKSREHKEVEQIDQNKLNELKGDQFELFVENLFNVEEFEILNRTEDLMRTKKGFHEDDTKPDFLIRNLVTDHIFYVECKYRSGLFDNKYNWSSYKQMCRYMRYAMLKKVPCFIVLGLGGVATNPKDVYCIPIERIKYPELYPSQFERFYHNPNESFQWDGMTLK